MNKFTELYNELQDPGTFQVKIEKIQFPMDFEAKGSLTCPFCGEADVRFRDPATMDHYYFLLIHGYRRFFSNTMDRYYVCMDCMLTVQKIVYRYDYNKVCGDKR